MQKYHLPWHNNSDVFESDLMLHTRGIWKVLSMVFYLSDQLKNPIMFRIILKSYFSSLFLHTFHEDVKMRTIIVNTCTVYILENAKFQWKI